MKLQATTVAPVKFYRVCKALEIDPVEFDGQSLFDVTETVRQELNTVLSAFGDATFATVHVG